MIPHAPGAGVGLIVHLQQEVLLISINTIRRAWVVSRSSTPLKQVSGCLGFEIAWVYVHDGAH